MKVLTLILTAGLSMGFATAQAQEADAAAELAKKLSNPVAALISVPIQVNYDEGYGVLDQGSVLKTTVQPVIPVSINENWNMISRTIIPFISQQDIPATGNSESGLGDITQSLFFSPTELTDNGWVLGAGPVFVLPTASNAALGGEKWGLGPTGLALKQIGPWTVGGLFNHVWSVAGESNRGDINSTFLQPFVTYVTQAKTTLGVNMESTYDWTSETWSTPINLTAFQLLKIGDQIIQVGGGLRYWAESPEAGPEGWGARFQLTFLFPK
jgi:hypothetical protein